MTPEERKAWWNAVDRINPPTHFNCRSVSIDNFKQIDLNDPMLLAIAECVSHHRRVTWLHWL